METDGGACAHRPVPTAAYVHDFLFLTQQKPFSLCGWVVESMEVLDGVTSFFPWEWDIAVTCAFPP